MPLGRTRKDRRVSSVDLPIADDAFSAMASPGPPERHRFGPFELQPDKRRLLKDGATISLRPRAFDLLAALVDRVGHLVTKGRAMSLDDAVRYALDEEAGRDT